MRKLILTMFALISLLRISAQNITEISAEQVGRTIEISYALDVRSDVTICYSLDGGKTFSAPMIHVHGDVGENVAPGKKLIVWNVSEDMSSLESKDVRFQLTAVENLSMKNKGVLRFNIEPQNASLYVDGYAKEKAPLKVWANQTHIIEVRADGYIPYSQKIVLNEGDEVDLDIKLSDHRDIRVLTNIPATFSIEKESRQNVDSTEWSLALGKHDLYIAVEGYEPVHKVLNVNKNSRSRYSIKLRPEIRSKHFVMLDFHYILGRAKAPMFGFRYGSVRKIGWYVAANASILGDHYGYDYKADNGSNGQSVNGVVPYYDGRVSRNALSIKGGMLVRMGCPLYLYFGGGVAYQSTTAMMTNGQWVLLGGKWSTRTAFEYEAGLMANIKGFALRAGFGQYVGRTALPVLGIGVGYMFDKSKK